MKFLRQLFTSTLATTAIVMIVIVLILTGAIPYSSEVFTTFLIGAVLLILGQTIFLVAIDESVISVGKLVGSALMKKHNIWIIILFGFLFGFVTTLAEPDVQVLVSQIITINPFIASWLLLSIFGIGCGIFVCFGLFRILKNISLKWVLFVMYSIIIVLCFFVPEMYVGISFDAGGVTTGCVTVPFILALATGLCAIRGKSNKDDTFGVIAITSIGPIIAILILGIIVGEPAQTLTQTVETSGFLPTLLTCCKDVFLSFAPLFAIFLFSHLVFLKLSHKQVAKISIGFLVSAIGLVIFLTGINFGFSNMGYFMGQTISYNTAKIVIIFVAAILGIFFVFTDPAIVVVVNQVEDITNGLLHKQVVFITLGIGVALACAVAIIHVLWQVSLLYILPPIYALAIILNIFTPKMFTALAFDSGGVASGSMTVAFFFPFAIGLCQGLGLDVLNGGFGIVGCVATLPIITVQVLGIIYAIKEKRVKRRQIENVEVPCDNNG